MRDLFFSECRRLAKVVAIVMVLHFLMQLQINRNAPFIASSWEVHLLAELVAMAAGLALAIYQFAPYRQESRWMWLLHRPLSRGAIFEAMAMAACAGIVAAVILPFVATLWVQQHFNQVVVEQRHYMMAVHAFLMTASAWLAGAYAMLNRKRTAVAVVLLPVTFALHLASVYVVLVPALLCLLVLAYITFGNFKPNREAPPSSGLAVFAAALPLQVGFHLVLLIGGTVLYGFGLRLSDRFPSSMAIAPAGSYTEAMRATGHELLADVRPDLAEQWRAEFRTPHMLVQDIRRYPVKDQLSNAGSTDWTDIDHNVRWSFSHDAMRFHGKDLITGADRGWYGQHKLDDAQPFAEMPIPFHNFMITKSTLYLRDDARQVLQPILTLTADENFVSLPETGAGHLYIMSNKRVIVIAIPNFGAAPEAPLYSIALPAKIADIVRAVVSESRKGLLLTVMSGRQLQENGGVQGARYLIHADAGGPAQLVAQRPVFAEFPLLYSHKAWWPSPLMYALQELPGRAIDTGKAFDVDPFDIARPLAVVAAALVCAVVSALLAWLWLRATTLPAGRKALWIVNCLLIGPAAVLSLIVLQPRMVVKRGKVQAGAAAMAA